MTGDLNIRDVTRPVSLDVVYSGQAKGLMGNMPAAFSAHKTTNRKDWGLNSNTALETGGLLVSDQPLSPDYQAWGHHEDKVQWE
jgi:polyisoprenoid-binding protein YceI